jgi:peptidoglycan/LPS O-acetylase OafA/YrhL
MAQQPGNRASRLPSLTGLRFLAAFLVLDGHLAAQPIFSNANIQQDYFFVLSRGAWTAVSFFFVLSGFVLTWAVTPGDTAGRFLRRRVTKIFPNHVVTWLVTILLMVGVGTAVAARSAVPNLFLIQAWFPQFDINSSVNIPSWSLSCELFFYLCFPLLHRAVRAIPARALWPVAAGIVGLIWLLPTLANALPATPVDPWFQIPSYKFWFLYLFPPTRTLEFLLGIVLVYIVRGGQWPRLPFSVAALLVVASYVGEIYVPIPYAFVAMTVASLALLIPAAATVDIRGTFSPFRGRVAVFLGEISFALYLVHADILTYGHRLLDNRSWALPQAVAVMVALVTVALVAAWLLYALVERPMMRRWSRPRRRVPAVPAVPVDPAAPVDLIDSVDLVELVEPVDPVDPVDPVEARSPAAPGPVPR